VCTEVGTQQRPSPNEPFIAAVLQAGHGNWNWEAMQSPPGHSPGKPRPTQLWKSHLICFPRCRQSTVTVDLERIMAGETGQERLSFSRWVTFFFFFGGYIFHFIMSSPGMGFTQG
jgi:hypothetical protein